MITDPGPIPDILKIDGKSEAAAIVKAAAEPTPGVEPPPLAPAAPEPGAPAGRSMSPEAIRSRNRRAARKTGKGGRPVATEPPVTDAPTDDEIRQQAEMMNSLIFGTMMTIGGEAWVPSGFKHGPITDEMSACNAALADYLRQHPDVKLPPWAGLAAAYGNYVGMRLMAPTVRTKLAFGLRGLFGRIRNWWRNRRKKPADAAGEGVKADDRTSPS